MKISGPALLLLLLSLSPLIAAGTETPEAEPPQEAGPPRVSSPWRNGIFDAPLERVRAELRALMTEDGLALTGEEKSDGSFATGLVEFDDKKFGADVSVPPPQLSNKYPYVQMRSMTSGRYGLEGRLVEESPDRTRLDLRALLEIRGQDHKARVMRWIPRYSNGEVERNYITRLHLRLLKAPGNTPPAR